MAKRLIWIAWTVSALLGAFAPLAPRLTGIPSSGRWCIFGAVTVMVAYAIWTRKQPIAVSRAISMSASGVTAGAAVGFAVLAGLPGSKTPGWFAVKWGLAAAFLGFLFWRELRPIPQALPEHAEELIDVFSILQNRYGTVNAEEIEAKLIALPEDERERERAFINAEFQRATEVVKAGTERLQRDLSRRLVTGGVCLFLLGLALVVHSMNHQK